MKYIQISIVILFLNLVCLPPALRAATDVGTQDAGVMQLETIEITKSSSDLIGIAGTASEGVVTQKQLEARPVYRPAELMETMPGLIVTQHSGEGKANQFYLRGINLDHGTDLRTTVDGMLINNRSHTHGQGWTDLNFFIPELAGGMQYKKGPYYAEEGDFASAGAVNIDYVDTLNRGVAEIGGGMYGYGRFLLADSPKLGQGNLLYAVEAFHNDGPFAQRDDYRKVNTVLRYSQNNPDDRFHVAFMLHNGKWNSTDQIPQRSLDTGLLSSRYNTIDPTDGGETQRYSLSGGWQHNGKSGVTKINAYAIHGKLDLFSNFTYFLNDPVNGDQIGQSDDRTTLAMNVSHTFFSGWNGREMENTFGIQLQNDNILNGLLQTRSRQILSTTRSDHIVEKSMGLYWQNNTRWLSKFRTQAGLRSDFYHFDVDSNIPANSGATGDSKTNPKLSLIFGPWANTEYYLSAGGGFRSNDARATASTVDPKTGLTTDKAPPLIQSWGYEAGVRTGIVPELQSTLSLFVLDIDSELVFQGDIGTTRAGRPSKRQGIELSNHYTPASWLFLDANYAYARARFRDDQDVGNFIPGATEGVATVGGTIDNIGPYFGTLQWRYLGPRPLIEDNSVRSSSTSLLNGRMGYKFSKDLRLTLEGFNLLDSKVNAVDYYYASRLPSEPAQGVNDIHFHPVEPRVFRVRLLWNF